MNNNNPPTIYVLLWDSDAGIDNTDAFFDEGEAYKEAASQAIDAVKDEIRCDAGKEHKAILRKLQRLVKQGEHKEAFHDWYEFQEGRGDPTSLRVQAVAIRDAYETLFVPEAYVHCADGDLIINGLTGHRINYVPDKTLTGAARERAIDRMQNSGRFDLEEYRQKYGKLEKEYDILDLGQWFGPRDTYEGPSRHFRRRVAKEAREATAKRRKEAAAVKKPSKQ